jgi:hypothetical protein
MTADGRVQLDGVHVHSRPGKVRQASDVVEVEVCLDDVAHVPRFVAQAPDLVDGGQARVDGGAGVAVGERPTQPGGDGRVVRRPQPGVDEDQPVAGCLDEEHVASERDTAQAQGGEVGAVEVMHAQ